MPVLALIPLVAMGGYFIYNAWSAKKTGAFEGGGPIGGKEQKLPTSAAHQAHVKKTKLMDFFKQRPWVLLLAIVPAVIFFILKRKGAVPDNLYYLGLVGKPAPKGQETARNYLSGVVAREREQRKHEKEAQIGKYMQGLPIQNANVTYGKYSGVQPWQRN